MKIIPNKEVVLKEPPERCPVTLAYAPAGIYYMGYRNYYVLKTPAFVFQPSSYFVFNLDKPGKLEPVNTPDRQVFTLLPDEKVSLTFEAVGPQ
jgi:hypothetical protein